MSAEYTVEVTNRTFKLSKSQIEYDSPNFFSSYFFDSHGSSMTRQLKITRDPSLFTIIMRYLNGYQVLPLHSSLVPYHCTPETALADLRADARFYQLNGLSRLLSSLKGSGDQSVLYAEITGHYNTKPDRLEPTESFDRVVNAFSFELSSQGEYQTAAQHDKFFTVPSNTKGGNPDPFFSGLLNERIVRRVLQRDGNATLVSDWELLGWKRDYPSEHRRQTSIFVKLWTHSGLVKSGSSPDWLA